MRKILIILMGLIPAVILISAVSLFIVIKTDGLRNAAELYATRILNRDVIIESLNVGWGTPLTISIHGLRLANAKWGTEPDMARVDDIEVRLNPWPLLHGKIVIQHISLTNSELFLERNAEGVGNWHFRHARYKGEFADPFHELAKDRAHFPLVLDGHITNGLFRMKTSGGALLRFKMHDLILSADDQKLPLTFAIDGTYNNVPTRLKLTGESYDILHAPQKPYGVDLVITTKSDTLNFQGTMTDPLDADGAIGNLTIDAPIVNEVIPMFGLNIKAQIPAKLTGHLTRAGDHWTFDNIDGHIAGNALSGKFELNEGSRAEPDAIKTALNFQTVNVKKIIDGISKSGPTRPSDLDNMSLQPEAKPGVTLDAHITAREAFYEPTHITDVDLTLMSQASKITLDPMTFTIASGHSRIKATLDGTGKLPHLTALMSLDGAEISRALKLTDNKEAITGKFTSHSLLDMTGATVLSALKNSHGGAVVIMNEGAISRSLLEKASMDLRALLRKGKGTTPITCALGIYNMKNGVGDLLPLRLRTARTVLNGAGWINLLDKQVDVTVRSKPSTTSDYALDWPLRFRGSFYDIGLLPAPGSNTTVLDEPIRTLMPKNLPPFLQEIASRSSCFN